MVHFIGPRGAFGPWWPAGTGRTLPAGTAVAPGEVR